MTSARGGLGIHLRGLQAQHLHIALCQHHGIPPTVAGYSTEKPLSERHQTKVYS